MNRQAAKSNAINAGFPRRRRAARPHAGPRSPGAAGSSSFCELAGGEATGEALEIARYVADMAAQLQTMSEAADLDLLAYFLGMARAEAEMFLHRTLSAAVSESAGEGDGWDVESRGPKASR
jgi:hypothetical protein